MLRKCSKITSELVKRTQVTTWRWYILITYQVNTDYSLEIYYIVVERNKIPGFIVNVTSTCKLEEIYSDNYERMMKRSINTEHVPRSFFSGLWVQILNPRRALVRCSVPCLISPAVDMIIYNAVCSIKHFVIHYCNCLVSCVPIYY
jgi:hypothetical protein